MLYRKNIPAWEQAVRLVAALGMAACAWQFRHGPVGAVFAVLAAAALLTGAFGFCPACALAGRRLAQRGKAPS